MGIKKNIIEYKDYGKTNITINKVMDAENVSVYELSKVTGLKHQTVKAYYNNDPLTRVDTDIIAKMCYVLDCDISDVLEYERPKESK